MHNPDLQLDPVWQSSPQKSTREGCGEALVELGQDNDQIMVLTADLAESTKVESFKNHYPDRFIEIGIAEQNLMGVAAGLASTGLIPFCSSYAVFSPGRNWEQLRASVCIANQNVKIIGSHAGLSVGPDGATHQALEDIALTQVLPNLTVLSPCDYQQAKQATIAAANLKGPVYLRLSREASHVITTAKTVFTVGKAQVMRYGESCTIIATGLMVAESLKAAEELNAEVINIHTIKPLDRETILQSVAKTKKVIVAEEHQIIGGLGSRIAQLLAEELPTPMRFIGVKDMFGQSGTAAELFEHYGLTWEHIVATSKTF